MGSRASLLGWLGVIAIVFGLIGVVMMFATGFVRTQNEWSTEVLITLGHFVLGFGLLLAALFSNLDRLRERMRTGEARRASRYGTSAVLSTVLGIALLGMLAFLGTRYNTRWDWTEARSHSLSQQTLSVLEGLDSDVAVTALYAPVSQTRARDLLERYTHVSDRFRVTYADPQAQPGLVRKLGVAEEKLTGGLIHVSLAGESVEVEEVDEQNLTNALVKLTRRDRKKVYFLEGHNERAVTGEPAKGKDGMGFAAEALANENYTWETLLLATQADVPEDADVVIVGGPTRPFHASELAALKRYVEGGGALLVLIDPRAQTNLAAELVGWGVSVGDDVVVDRMQGLFGRPVSPFAAEYAAHPITESLREATLFHVARSVKATSGAEGAFTELVRTSKESWGERDLESFYAEGRAELGAGDLSGPVPVAVAGSPPGAEEAGSSARLVVFGDSDFVTNQLFREFRNRDLFVNAVNWLLGDVEAITIRPGQPRASRLKLTREDFVQLRYLSLFVLPEAIAALGVYAWWSRRRAPGR